MDVNTTETNTVETSTGLQVDPTDYRVDIAPNTDVRDDLVKEMTTVDNTIEDDNVETPAEPEPKKEFDFEDVFEDEEEEEPKKEEELPEGEFVVGKYDLSEFKDEINFEDEEVKSFLNEQSKAMEEAGFTQKQVEFYINEKLSDFKQQERASSPEYLKERLQNELSNEERRDYKVVGNFLKGMEGIDVNEIMADPDKYKLARAMYKAKDGKDIDPAQGEPKQSRTRYDHRTAKTEYITRLKMGEKPKSIINDLIEHASDKNAMRNEFKDYLSMLS